MALILAIVLTGLGCRNRVVLRGVNYHGKRGRFVRRGPEFCHFRATKARAKVKAKR